MKDAAKKNYIVRDPTGKHRIHMHEYTCVRLQMKHIFCLAARNVFLVVSLLLIAFAFFPILSAQIVCVALSHSLVFVIYAHVSSFVSFAARKARLSFHFNILISIVCIIGLCI